MRNTGLFIALIALSGCATIGDREQCKTLLSTEANRVEYELHQARKEYEERIEAIFTPRDQLSENSAAFARGIFNAYFSKEIRPALDTFDELAGEYRKTVLSDEYPELCRDPNTIIDLSDRYVHSYKLGLKLAVQSAESVADEIQGKPFPSLDKLIEDYKNHDG